jgi:small subunit ribosomal protein S13
MIIIGGYRINEEQRIFTVLQKIYGIGLNKANQIVCMLGFTKNLRFKEIDYSYYLKLNKMIIHYVHGFRAKRNLRNNIINLFENKCYRGVRHSYFLSVRGQRTRTNAKTQRKKKNKKNKVIKKK